MLAIAAKYEKEIHKSIWMWCRKRGTETGHWATENGGQGAVSPLTFLSICNIFCGTFQK